MSWLKPKAVSEKPIDNGKGQLLASRTQISPRTLIEAKGFDGAAVARQAPVAVKFFGKFYSRRVMKVEELENPNVRDGGVQELETVESLRVAF